MIFYSKDSVASSIAVPTDAAGFAQLTFTPQKGQTLKLSLAAKDQKGNTGQATFNFKTKSQPDDDTVLLRVDKSLYRVGDQLQIRTHSTRKIGSLYIDIIKDGQTYLTRTLTLKDGQASDRLSLDATLAGTVQINAYLIGANGVIVRDRRLVIVDPSDLRVMSPISSVFTTFYLTRR